MEPIIYDAIKDIPMGQIQSVWDLIAQGYYSDLFFNKWTPYIGVALRNNLALLLLIAIGWHKFSKFTKGKWDDKASNWLVNFLTRKKSGGAGPNKPTPAVKPEKAVPRE